MSASSSTMIQFFPPSSAITRLIERCPTCTVPRMAIVSLLDVSLSFGGAPLLDRYERITFDPDLVRLPGAPTAALVALIAATGAALGALGRLGRMQTTTD